MTKVVALHADRCPKFCFGCNKPFPVRRGRTDRRFYARLYRVG